MMSHRNIRSRPSQSRTHPAADPELTGSGLVEDDVRSSRRPNLTGGTTTDRRPLAIVSVHASPLAALGSQENGGVNGYGRALCGEWSRHGVPTAGFTPPPRHAGPGPAR